MTRLVRHDKGLVDTSQNEQFQGERQATHTNKYLPFDLHHPIAHKASTVRTLMSRASALSSNSVERVAEEKRNVDVLKKNGYPLNFIQRLSGNISRTSRAVDDDQRPPRTSLTLPTLAVYPRQSEGSLDLWTSR